ncbi:MAG: glycosyltransferase family 2 protein [Prevotella sp.]|nr:glycosyltransferase family 2 protein [Prevotella sp.]
MKVSVIIPIYNVENYIEACIASVAAQTFHDFDVIAVDDCTQDSSIEVLQASIEKYGMPKDKITVIRHERNRGLSASRNTGIEASNSEYVFFLDSDDTITPNCLELLVNASKWLCFSLDMVVGNYVIAGPEIGCPHINVDSGVLSRRAYIKAYCKELIYPMAWNRLIRRDFLLKHKLFFEEGLIHEDTLWSFQLLKYIGRVGVVKDNTYIYRIRQNSLQSSSDFECHFKAKSCILGKLTDIMFGCSLKYDRYVFDFVEKEKIRLLYDCYSSGKMHLVRELYTVIRNKPHFMPWQAKLFFGYSKPIYRRIVQRDEHYNQSFEDGLKVFSNLPNAL